MKALLILGLLLAVAMATPAQQEDKSKSTIDSGCPGTAKEMTRGGL
jgi:hypothetical protein